MIVMQLWKIWRISVLQLHSTSIQNLGSSLLILPHVVVTTSQGPLLLHKKMWMTRERAQILADAVALKKLAVDYAHPELGVITNDPATCGRNYFSRPSSVAQADVDDTRERAKILTDAASLKKLAVDYAHPEFGVINTDFTTCGRNYFSRPSSIAQEDVDVEGRAQILADAITLKKLAVDYAHPELGVLTTDPATYGRNYFSRPSSVAQDED